MKEKLYFREIDSNWCYTLDYHMSDAINEGLDTITLYEANKAEGSSYIFCKEVGEATEKTDCNKRDCDMYASKSGRGVCMHRGQLYEHGEEVTFDVKDTNP